MQKQWDGMDSELVLQVAANVKRLHSQAVGKLAEAREMKRRFRELLAEYRAMNDELEQEKNRLALAACCGGSCDASEEESP